MIHNDPEPVATDHLPLFSVAERLFTVRILVYSLGSNNIRRKNADIRMLLCICRQLLKKLRILDKRIAVQNNTAFASKLLPGIVVSGIVSGSKTDILFQKQQSDILIPAVYLLKILSRTVGRSVIHDDDVTGILFKPPDMIDAFCRDLHILIVQNDVRCFHGRRQPPSCGWARTVCLPSAFKQSYFILFLLCTARCFR